MSKAPPPRPPAPRRRTKNAENVTPSSTRLTTSGTATTLNSLDKPLQENDAASSQQDGYLPAVIKSKIDGTKKTAEKSLISHELEPLVNALGISTEPSDSKPPDGQLVEIVPISPSRFETSRTSVDFDRPNPLDSNSPNHNQSPSRNKPLPPTPRSRSGTNLTLPSISSASPSASISPVISRASSVQVQRSVQVDTSESESQGPPKSPLKLQPEVDKRKPPLPPISRRVSLRAPALAGENKVRSKSLLPPPPPPPIRRNKSTTSRSSCRGGQSLIECPTIPSTLHTPYTPLPLPPTPLRPKRPQSMINSHGSATLPRLPSYIEELGKLKEKAGPDILDDLQALQREVDELRGKFQVESEEECTRASTEA